MYECTLLLFNTFFFLSLSSGSSICARLWLAQDSRTKPGLAEMIMPANIRLLWEELLLLFLMMTCIYDCSTIWSSSFVSFFQLRLQVGHYLQKVFLFFYFFYFFIFFYFFFWRLLASRIVCDVHWLNLHRLLYSQILDTMCHYRDSYVLQKNIY